MTIQASKPYEVEVARNRDTGEEIPYLLTIHTSVPLAELKSAAGRGAQGFMNDVVQSINGLDMFEPSSPYSFRIAVAKCFDIEEVRDAVVAALERAQSDIEIVAGPKLVT